MSVTVAVVGGSPGFAIADVTLGGAYATGGYQLSPQAFGFSSQITGALMNGVNGFLPQFVPGSSRLKMFELGPPLISQVVAVGGGSATDIAVPGLVTTSSLISVLGYTAGGVPVDYSSVSEIHADEVIRVGANTGGQSLVVTFVAQFAIGAEAVDGTDLNGYNLRVFAWGA